MRTYLTCLALLGACLSGSSQLVLNPGDTWTYQFSTLPFVGTTNAFLANPSGIFGFTVNSNTFQPGDALRYDMFENSTAESPIFTGTMSSAPPFTVLTATNDAWQDLQGAIRFTMESGSVTVDSVTLGVIQSGPSLSSYDVYETTFVPVPEPGFLSLLGSALGTGFVWTAWRRKSGRRVR